jgi:hypothetical protein
MPAPAPVPASVLAYVPAPASVPRLASLLAPVRTDPPNSSYSPHSESD